ncbi:MAG: DUF4241 domain-containing protein [Polyangiales bacterium]
MNMNNNTAAERWSDAMAACGVPSDLARILSIPTLSRSQLPREYHGLETRILGLLDVHSGRIFACDSFSADRSSPYELSVPNGTYPVCFTIVPKTGVIAFASIEVGMGVPESWVAVRRQPTPERREFNLNYVPIDTGSVAIMDAADAPLFGTPIDRLGRDAFLEEFGMRSIKVKAFQHNFEGRSAYVVSSGRGDGAYRTYAGHDARGALVSLVMDFNVIAT